METLISPYLFIFVCENWIGRKILFQRLIQTQGKSISPVTSTLSFYIKHSENETLDDYVFYNSEIEVF